MNNLVLESKWSTSRVRRVLRPATAQKSRCQNLVFMAIMHQTYPRREQPSLARGSRLSSVAFFLTLSGDVHLNHGPSTPRWKYPCGICAKPVKRNQKGICCDFCNRWFHTCCCAVDDHTYDILSISSCSWICCDCGLPNFSDSFFDSSVDSFADENIFDSFNCSPDEIPAESVMKTAGTDSSLPPSHKPKSPASSVVPPLKIVVANCNGIGGSKSNADFRSFMDLHQPDIMLGCESKLDGEPTYSVFPANYTVYRKDRNSHGGGVFKDIYPSYPLYPSTANCEIVWASLELQSHKKVLLASFYRLPNSNSEIMDQFCYSVNKVFQDLLLIFHNCWLVATLIYQELIGRAIQCCHIRIYNNLQPLLIVSWTTALIRSSSTPHVVKIYLT